MAKLQAASNKTYPIAGRHSQQSWHERYKKNAGTFSRRVERYIEEGIDTQLKTYSERIKTAALVQPGQANKGKHITEIADQ
jgi:hypothetical protein